MLFSCCIDFAKRPDKSSEMGRLKDIGSHLGSLDWSKPVIIIKSHPILDAVVPVDSPPVDTDTLEFVIPRIPKSPDFNDLFQWSYQKCLYGPLTFIPRPLK